MKVTTPTAALIPALIRFNCQLDSDALEGISILESSTEALRTPRREADG